MKRILIACLLVLVSVVPARAQGTTMPHPLIQWFTNAGAVFSDGGLCVFVAGTSTLATTYTTSFLASANSNPIEFNSAGRATSGGVFLEPGNSYKFVLKNFAGVVSPTCIPDTGVTIFTVDNVEAVPLSNTAVDVLGTVGDPVVAGSVVYLSDGTDGGTPGEFYLADADNLLKSTTSMLVGLTPFAADDGEVTTIRIAGEVTIDDFAMSPGAAYYVDSIAGGLTLTPPTNALRMGYATSPSVLAISRIAAPVGPAGPPCGRLTLTTGVPAPTSDVTGAATLFYAPYGGCDTIPTFNGTSWELSRFTQLSIAAPGGSTVYDVFVYNNAGVLTLQLTAWTSDVTRATALTTQDGVLTLTGSLTRLYLGTIRTVAGTLDDSTMNRHVWNYYHRVRRPLLVQTADVTWNYTLATWRQANTNAANQVSVVVGGTTAGNSALMFLRVSTSFSNTNANVSAGVGIGRDSTSVPLDTGIGVWNSSPAASATAKISATYELNTYIPAGRYVFVWLEYSEATGTTTWQGNNGATPQTHIGGMIGWIDG